MIINCCFFTFSFIHIMNRKFWIQIRSLMQTALNLFRFELRLLKDRIIRQKIYRCSRLSRLSDLRKKSVFQFNDRNSALISVMVYRPITLILTSIYVESAFTTEEPTPWRPPLVLYAESSNFPPAWSVVNTSLAAEIPFLMHINRNSPPVIGYCCRSVFF